MNTTMGPAPTKSATGGPGKLRRGTNLLLVLTAALFAWGCSPSRIVASSMGDALAENSLVYAGDDDIELVGSAIPFGLKTIETLLVEVPEHQGLLKAAARGFTQYSYVYVQLPADETEERADRDEKRWDHQEEVNGEILKQLRRVERDQRQTRRGLGGLLRFPG